MNKLILEDKEYTLSDELIEKIKTEVEEQEKKISPFTRNTDEDYFYISYDGTVHATMDGKFSVDDKIFSVGNYSVLDSCPIEDYPIKPNKEADEFELIEDYYNE